MNDNEYLRIKEIVIQTLKGGDGSGNFGHAGRPGEIGGSSDNGGSTKTSNSLSDAIKNANSEYSSYSPHEITHGHCYEWALAVHNKFPEAKVMDVDLRRLAGKPDLPYHVWIKYGGKIYDAEAPNGVKNFLELPYFQTHNNQEILPKLKPREFPLR